MSGPPRYDPRTAEPELAASWTEENIYAFDRSSGQPVFAIDTPPPSVSGHLHLGNVYSYSHTDFIARYRRMRGDRVFYPMGFDDNGLPSERLVERELGITPADIGREEFIQACLQTTREFATQYRAVWDRLGLSVDWKYTYHTIDAGARRAAQSSFLHLLADGRAYRREAPVIWCPECRTAIAQAEVDDLERETRFVTLLFRAEGGHILPVATTRPELLPACVAVFVHPDDERYASFVGRDVHVPLTGELVRVYADAKAQPDKGTGAVMCCTFGDSTDIEWWYEHGLQLKSILTPEGRLSSETGEMAGLSVAEARSAAISRAERAGQLLGTQPAIQTVRVHERCGTPVEYLVTRQWFIRVLDSKDDLQAAGDSIQWVPPSMHSRYRDWIQNLRWDWLISRQRTYGVPFPVWYCSCGRILSAREADLPVDPTVVSPPHSCDCGSDAWLPETDVMDTWATSSLTPQIAGRQHDDPTLFAEVFPMSLRPQAHEIIRTWAFYTIVQSQFASGQVPWSTIMVSGWGVAPQGEGKISKSKGGGPMSPMEMLEQWSADAVRYWAASTGPGKDAVISQDKIAAGSKLATKVWNVGSFAGRFLQSFVPPDIHPPLSAADAWILSALDTLIQRCTEAMDAYDYATAKTQLEIFFWRDLADNYLEMAKGRLYDADDPLAGAARYTLHHALLTTLKLFAPFLPYVTDAVYREVFRESCSVSSIHLAGWPNPVPEWHDPRALEVGEVLVNVAATIRRYKSDRSMSLGAPTQRVVIEAPEPIVRALAGSISDIRSVTRAQEIELVPSDLPGPRVVIPDP